ncbi:MAG: endolytic transglycosylase MltG [Polyangiales bacterium]
MLARGKLALLGLLAIAWIAATAALAWLVIALPHVQAKPRGRDAALEVPKPVTVDGIADALAEGGVTAHPRLLAFYLRVLGVGARLREGVRASGSVVGNPSLTPYLHLPRVARGYGDTSVDVVVPEGFTSFDVATRLARFTVADREALLATMRDPALLSSLGIPAPSAEGYLFPALYRMQLDSAPEKVLTKMVSTFRTRTAPLFLPYTRAELATPVAVLDAHQLVTLASIVEREARVPEERPIIAGVFANRLFEPGFAPRRLQADPTVAYGCLVAAASVPSCAAYDGKRVTPAMVRDPENPYSTYKHEGLPPGPISNPGLSALSAAVAPERHDFFYFVAKGGGRHAFSHSLADHNRNIRGGAAPAAPVPSPSATPSPEPMH